MQNRILAYSNHFLVLALFILLLSPINSDLLFGKPQFKNDIDSLQSLVQKCPTDTCKFAILHNYFWQNSGSDSKQIKTIGSWAFDIIKKSKNQKACADGYDIKGNIFEKEGKYDSAYFCFESALGISKSINYKYRMAWSNYHMAELMVPTGNLNATLINFKNAEKLFSDINENSQYYNSICYISNLYEYAGNYDSSNVYNFKRLKYHKQKSDKASETKDYLIIAGVFIKQYKTKESLQFLHKALQLAEDIKDPSSLAIVYSQIGDFFINQKKNNAIALEYYNKSLEICNKDKDNNQGMIATLYNQIGNIYLRQSKDSIALTYNLKSLELAQKLNHRHILSDSYKSLGFTYKNLKDHELSLYYYKKCFEMGCNSCPKITFHEALIEIADLYTKVNRPGDALVYYEKALDLAIAYRANKEIAKSNLKLGDFYFKTHNHQLAEMHFLSSLKTAKEANDILSIKESAERLYTYYYQTSNFRNASNFMLLARNMKDSLAEMDKMANMAELEMKFEFEKIKNENQTKEIASFNEIARQKLYRNFSILISGLLAFLGILVFAGYRRKKHANQVLASQKEEIVQKNLEIQSQIEEIITQRDEILAQKDEIERISEKLHESDQAKLRFFTNISHEFRTPLTLILGPIEKLIKGHTVNDEATQLMNIIQRNTYQLFNLINQLLDIRKLETGNNRLKIAYGNIAAYCKGICTTFNHLAEENNISYTFNCVDEEINCWFDRDVLEKALNNLLSNAFKYSSGGGKISIMLSYQTNVKSEIDRVKITIADNGNGIPDDQIKYVFDRYYQVENNNTGFNTGTGIGLAYTKELIELHQGSIEVTSEINRGTTFTIELPVHKTYYLNDQLVTIDINNAIEVMPDGMRLRYLKQTFEKNDLQQDDELIDLTQENEHSLLIVEDNTDLRTFVKSIFRNDFTIYEAPDGLKGYQLADKLVPDVIISDVMMPKMDGIELCRKLKGNIHTSHIPVLLLTARVGEQHELEGLKTGADDYLSKPFNSEILEARVNGLIALKQNVREHFTRQFLLNPKVITIVSPEDIFLKKVVTLVEDNISNPEFDVEQLTSELGLSRMQLFRKLKALTNYSASEFIRNIRLKRAAQLLQDSSLNISEVLYQSGFTNRSYFATCFKTMYGCSPKEYASKTEEKKV